MAETVDHVALEWDTPLFLTARTQFEHALPHASVPDRVAERLRSRAGATAASCSVSVPVRGSGSVRGITIPSLPPSDDRRAFANPVSAGYFDTFGLTLLRGRELADSDGAEAAPVAVIDDQLAREYFGDADPLGKTLQFGVRDPREPMTIVGIVGNVHQEDSLRDARVRTVYTPLAQEYDVPRRLTVAVRSTEPTASLTAAARTETRAVSGDAVVTYVRTMEQQIGGTMVRERVLVLLAAVIGTALIVDSLAIRPLEMNKKRLEQRVVETRNNVKIAEAALKMQEGVADPDAVKRSYRDALRKQLAEIDQSMQGLQRGLVPPEKMAKLLEADQMKTIAFPEGSLVGDWRRGERIAQSGTGSTWSDRAGAPGGGSCYNCHQLGPQEASFGTLGPSLRNFGKLRGNGPDIQRYVYGKIYNAKAYNLCSQMPRLGYAGTLSPEQIRDLVGLLLDPASPVNQ